MSEKQQPPEEQPPQAESIFRAGTFTGQTALITGGGSGIGLAIAAELRMLGANVVICGRTVEKLEKAQAYLDAIGGEGRVWHYPCNIRSTESIDELIAATLEEFERIDHLVNNAGGQFPSPAAMISEKGWHAVIETNLTGTFHMSQRVARASMIPSGGGAIVNIIAQMWNGFPMMAHTGAARAGVDNITKSLGLEWAQAGIRVNAVAPGIIESVGIKSYSEANRKFFYGSIPWVPAARLGTPREVAAAAVFLLSPAAGFITGTTLKVDGGEPLYGNAAAGQHAEIFRGKPTQKYE